MKYQNIYVDIIDNVALITLNRPKALNALNTALFKELNEALKKLDIDSKIGSIVITGSTKSFAAGADIVEMKDFTFKSSFNKELLIDFTEITKIKKPIIAAVNGYALGGGCELAMMCDIIYAGENAKFGQPEIKIGIIPGAGGTQRLVKAIGKSKAMEVILTGSYILTAHEAEKAGLVSKVLPVDKVVEEAINLGKVIASNPRIIVEIAKETVNQSFEMNLSAGLLYERRMNHSCFSTEDQKEGMKAFIEKRRPNFNSKL